jgi:hypothetical protein
LDFLAEGNALKRFKRIDLALILSLEFREQFRPSNMYPTIECDHQPLDFNLTDEAWRAPSGALVAWFQDPDGHTLSITQFK